MPRVVKVQTIESAYGWVTFFGKSHGGETGPIKEFYWSQTAFGLDSYGFSTGPFRSMQEATNNFVSAMQTNKTLPPGKSNVIHIDFKAKKRV